MKKSDAFLAKNSVVAQDPIKSKKELMEPLVVTQQEVGLKLLRFLERRLLEAPPTGQLHKWIRTGQVRVNQKRVQSFHILALHDVVRIPPFATPRPLTPLTPCADGQNVFVPHTNVALSTQTNISYTDVFFPENIGKEKSHTPSGVKHIRSQPFLGDDLPIVAMQEDLIIVSKPAGLAVQPGSGVTDSVVERLHKAFAGAAYIPAPVHRLDKATSGLLAIAPTHASASALSLAFTRPGDIGKEYIAVVEGITPFSHAHACFDILEKKRDSSGFERMYCRGDGRTIPLGDDTKILEKMLVEAEKTGEALLVVQEYNTFLAPFSCGYQNFEKAREIKRSESQKCKQVHSEYIENKSEKNCTFSWLRIQLLTGKKHQIRAQLAHRGFPLVGDGRYKGLPFTRLLLHASTLIFSDGRTYELAPSFPSPFNVE